MVVDHSVLPEDLLPVRSRISWGAIVAGSVLSLALYFLLTLLGGAIGFSISGSTSASGLTTAAAVWAIIVTAGCLFIGGFVASQFTVGENKTEAAIYGLLVWATVFTMLLWLMATGVKAGFNAMIGVATVGTTAVNATAQNTTQADWEAAAQRAGVPVERITEWKEKARNAPADIKATIDDPATKQKAEAAAREAGEAATKVTWYTFLGTLVSMIAAALGGYVGSGAGFRIVTVPARPLARA
jgi:hypothetical protein